jgi:uncharacterized protein (UPF0303 family)
MNETMKILLEQEEKLQFDSFSNEDALQLGLIICKYAMDAFGKGIAVHIENDEHPLFTHFMAGTSKENIYWINAKKNVVNHFGHSSLHIGEMYRDRGTSFKESGELPLSEYQAEGGSFPLMIRGQGKIGTITVSGLTGEEDHRCVVEGIKKYYQNKEFVKI